MLLNKDDFYNKNPWWLDNKIIPPENDWVHRDLYYQLKKDLRLPMILNILGLRRVGKSTIAKQLIADLLSSDKEPRHIFYYQFDEYKSINTTQNLEDILNYYLETILKQKIFSLKKRVYVFFDEIQYVPDWQAVLKKYYDLSNKKIKFVITGSQSILLRKKTRESLAGRILDYHLTPLSFLEFLKIKGKTKNNWLENNFDIFKLDKIWSELEKLNYQYGTNLARESKEYVLTGQFPECLGIGNQATRNVYLRESVIGKIMEDILTIYDIDKREHFKILSFYLLKNSGNLLELKNIAREIGLSFLSVDKYFGFLQRGYLFKILYKKHKTSIKQGRILKKIYTTSSNFVSAMENYQSEDFRKNPEAFGHIIETTIFNFLDAHYAGDKLINQISFWRQGGKEIDFLLKNNKKEIPLEVKFTNDVNEQKLKSLLNYSQQKKINFSVVITKNKLEKKTIKKQKIYFLPYYLLLLFNNRK